MRPQLPVQSEYAPYLREIDERRYYSNFGPLVQRFEQRLAGHFHVDPENTVTVANGTTALSAALHAVGAQPGSTCLLPSWTFVASAAAVCAAGLIPHFVDVSEETWQLDGERLRHHPALRGAGAVMPVSPFGAPVNARAWDRFWDDTGVPVVIDAAASFDATGELPDSAPGRAPVVISLHATKAFGIGEGGLVLSTAADLVRRVRRISNFGIWQGPQSEILGYNGKVSEYHAAVGLAALEQWPRRRAELQSRTQRYRTELKRLPDVRTVPGFGCGWVSAYCTTCLPAPADTIAAALAEAGIETRRWWQQGVHHQAAYRHFPHDDLPVTANLAQRVLSLPFFHDMSDEQIVQVVEAVDCALPRSSSERTA